MPRDCPCLHQLAIRTSHHLRHPGRQLKQVPRARTGPLAGHVPVGFGDKVHLLAGPGVGVERWQEGSGLQQQRCGWCRGHFTGGEGACGAWCAEGALPTGRRAGHLRTGQRASRFGELVPGLSSWGGWRAQISHLILLRGGQIQIWRGRAPLLPRGLGQFRAQI